MELLGCGVGGIVFLAPRSTDSNGSMTPVRFARPSFPIKSCARPICR
jgi:hypothetical protein